MAGWRRIPAVLFASAAVFFGSCLLLVLAGSSSVIPSWRLWLVVLSLATGGVLLRVDPSRGALSAVIVLMGGVMLGAGLGSFLGELLQVSIRSSHPMFGPGWENGP